MMIQTQIITKILQEGYKKWVIDNALTEEYFSDQKEEFNFLKSYYEQYQSTPSMLAFLEKFDFYQPLFEREAQMAPRDPDADPKVVMSAMITELKNDARTREVNKLLSNLQSEHVSNLSWENETRVNQLIRDLQKVSDKYSTVDLKSEESYIDDLKDKFAYAQTHKNDLHIPVGVMGLEDLHGWDKDADYAVIAGRTGHGKSYIMCQCALTAALQGLRVGYLSLEMPWIQMEHRITSLWKHFSFRALEDGDETIEQQYMDFLSNERSKLHIIYAESTDFGKHATPSQIESFCVRNRIDILFIDQMSFLDPDGKKTGDYRDVSEISRSLKIIRDRLNIPIIVANQLNRTKKEGGEIDTIQLAGSDAVGQDATKIIAVEQIEEEINGEKEKLIKLTIVKNRNGKSFGKIKLKLDYDHGQFYRPEEIINHNLLENEETINF